MKKANLLFVLPLIVLISCTQGQKDCISLKNNFTSYSEAIASIQNTKFLIEDDVNTSSSSWIRSASYYSCDGKTGYLIIGTDSRDYIHANLPYDVWKGFKLADSFGSFYNANIKSRYQLRLAK